MAETKETPKKTTAKVVEKPTKEVVKESKKTSPAKTTKAGKHSAKAQAEVAAADAKTKRKRATKAAEETPKPTHTPKVVRHTKNYKAALELLEKNKLYSLAEALELLPKLSKVKFDATAELHATLGIDPRQSDQFVRTSVVLPAGTGKAVRIAVLADDKVSESAKKAGADRIDAEKLLGEIEKGKFNFDVLIATPATMASLGKYAKALGPKGLMPSPKAGTVTPDPAKAVEEIKKGRLEIKNDAQGIVHLALGKLSFKASDLEANAKAAIAALLQAKPAGVKTTFVRSMYLTSSMSPSIKLDVTSVASEVK